MASNGSCTRGGAPATINGAGRSETAQRSGANEDRQMSAPEPLYILGAGMHPWGKWGRDFTEYGVVAARAALAEAGLDWQQIQLVAGADTIRNGYPGFIAGSTFAQKLGWNGVPVSSSYAACASGSPGPQNGPPPHPAGFF